MIYCGVKKIPLGQRNLKCDGSYCVTDLCCQAVRIDNFQSHRDWIYRKTRCCHRCRSLHHYIHCTFHLLHGKSCNCHCYPFHCCRSHKLLSLMKTAPFKLIHAKKNQSTAEQRVFERQKRRKHTLKLTRCCCKSWFSIRKMNVNSQLYCIFS